MSSLAIAASDSVALPCYPIDPPPLPQELIQMGVKHEKWDVNAIDLTHIDLKNPPNSVIDEILKGNNDRINSVYEFKTPEGSLDLVQLSPQTPNLNQLLVKFKAVHTHDAPEIRLILNGEGVFRIYNQSGEQFDILTTKGSFLVIPAGIDHNFELTDKHAVTALRIFQDKEGWVAKPPKVMHS